MDVSGKRVVVAGMAQTGVAVARFLHRRGAAVVAADGKPREALEREIALVGGIVEFEVGGIREATLADADLVVMSPGVPLLPAIAAARDRGVEVIAEIELAYRFFDAQATLIAITGTNGKSTTTALTGTLCEASGRPTFCGGNLGNHPLVEAVDHPANGPDGIIVAEVAGFMLENCSGFRPKVAACLNITEDHLERFKTMEVYAATKNKIFESQRESDFAIANANDELVMAGARSSRAQLYRFGAETSRGAFIDGDDLVIRGPWGEERYPHGDLPLIGRHNLENALVAFLAARLANVDGKSLLEAARSFVPCPHRMERVDIEDELVFYDDSKGTNVAAVAASLAGFPKPVVLIAGGVDKGGSYRPLFEAFDPVARGLVLIGDAAEIIAAAAAEYGIRVPVVQRKSMDEAVAAAVDLARPGDAIMLSPACSSYDMFKNFSERGEVFQRAVLAQRGKK